MREEVENPSFSNSHSHSRSKSREGFFNNNRNNTEDKMVSNVGSSLGPGSEKKVEKRRLPSVIELKGIKI